jgi:hypothetical protein
MTSPFTTAINVEPLDRATRTDFQLRTKNGSGRFSFPKKSGGVCHFPRSCIPLWTITIGYYEPRLAHRLPGTFLTIVPAFRCDLFCPPDVPGGAHRKDVFIAAGVKDPFQKPTTLIVKKVFIPFIFHQLG